MGYHTPSRGDHGIQNGFLGIVWISIQKCHGWKYTHFQTDYESFQTTESYGILLDPAPI
jgi:hypothetical protein